MVRLIALVVMLLAVPSLALADPIPGAVAATLVGWGVNATVASIAAGLLTSTAFNMVAGAIRGQTKPTSGSVAATQLKQDSSLPSYRFVYGEGWAVGTPTGIRVKGRIMYGCWILNSRPSVGPFVVMLDKRDLKYSGDPFDFNGAGSVPTEAPLRGFARFWIGRGDQTTVPKLILDEMPDEYQASDAWRGLTVIWFRMDCHTNDHRQERWPSTPPEVIVSGKWSKVWDMRDPDQDREDPATWTWSANHALCTLDALRHNPIKPYADRHLWLETWEWAADVADERVAVKGGGTIPRYEVNGTIVYAEGAELEDQLSPLMIAGAARFVRARGQLGIIPGCPQVPAASLTDMTVGNGASLQRYEERDNLSTAVAGTYLSPSRAYEDTALPTFILPGAQDEDGGLEQLMQPDLSLITDPRQGQRVQKILLMRSRMQRSITAEFPPVAFDLVAGSWTDTAFPAPFARWSGRWEVQSTLPQADLAENGGVALRCQMTLREVSDAVYAWDAETEEQAVEEYAFDTQVTGVQPPEDVLVDMSDANDQTASGVLRPRFKVTFDASPSGSVTGYEWQIRLDGADWPDESETVSTSALQDDAARITAFGEILSQTALHDFRIRAVGVRGASGWIVIPGLARDFQLSNVAFVGGPRTLTLSATAPGNAAFFGVRLFRFSGQDFDPTTQVRQIVNLQPGKDFEIVIEDAAPGSTNFWAVPITQTYSEGRPDGPHPVIIENIVADE